jgi:hypothetical protein
VKTMLDWSMLVLRRRKQTYSLNPCLKKHLNISEKARSNLPTIKKKSHDDRGMLTRKQEKKMKVLSKRKVSNIVGMNILVSESLTDVKGGENT